MVIAAISGATFISGHRLATFMKSTLYTGEIGGAGKNAERPLEKVNVNMRKYFTRNLLFSSAFYSAACSKFRVKHFRGVVALVCYTSPWGEESAVAVALDQPRVFSRLYQYDCWLCDLQKGRHVRDTLSKPTKGEGNYPGYSHFQCIYKNKSTDKTLVVWLYTRAPCPEHT